VIFYVIIFEPLFPRYPVEISQSFINMNNQVLIGVICQAPMMINNSLCYIMDQMCGNLHCSHRQDLYNSRACMVWENNHLHYSYNFDHDILFCTYIDNSQSHRHIWWYYLGFKYTNI